MKKAQQQILEKLFWRRNSKWLIPGAAAGACIGLLLLLVAVQSYFEVKAFFSHDASESGQFVQLNKKVSVFNTLGVKAVFTAKEFDTIRDQAFVLDVGKFIANDFKVAAYNELLGFYTELFFESVPDRFLDVDEHTFRWSEGQRELPVILSRDYLALYNFGFAPSQGLPQLSMKSAGRLVMKVRISGNDRQQTFEGRIVGFSDRINSILVPASFLEWANQEFGSSDDHAPARLILQVTNPLSEAFQDFLEKNGYEVSTGRLIGGHFIVLFRLLVSVVALLGLFILLLSAQIFSLNYQLLISRNAMEIKRLIQLGYLHKTISDLLTRRFLQAFALVILVAFSVLWLLKTYLTGSAENQGLNLPAGLHIGTWIIGLAIICLLTVLTVKRIRSHILKLS